MQKDETMRHTQTAVEFHDNGLLMCFTTYIDPLPETGIVPNKTESVSSRKALQHITVRDEFTALSYAKVSNHLTIF